MSPCGHRATFPRTFLPPSCVVSIVVLLETDPPLFVRLGGTRFPDHWDEGTPRDTAKVERVASDISQRFYSRFARNVCCNRGNGRSKNSRSLYSRRTRVSFYGSLLLRKEDRNASVGGEIISSSLFELPYRYNDRYTRDYSSDP